MKYYNLSFILTFFIFGSFSCKKDNTTDFPLTFKLQTANSGGLVTTSFSKTDTIHFQLLISNTTNQDVNLNNFMPDLICNSKSDLFRAYSATGTDMGRPCINTNCTDIGLIVIKAGSTQTIDYPRPSAATACNTASLTFGTYNTGLSYTFATSNATSNQVLKTSFSITN
ncbi:hypothetical protein [Mucilaginibacter paludis]|uniref:Lipoprotein n=1 Tax=Mucilaginibacter paludis DSM 18603 TaxID=714943 RepID=H1YHZ7_9SPHI|nr:hypothetical protein [Mucilaginibacter paludis]EHQ25545.1 hypothetical protein Mucpa_1385 [Mucilaginibacter paludis DSM 18603]